MNVVSEIRELFATAPKPSAVQIKALPEEYPALVIRIADGYGVAIQVRDDLVVSEKFNNCQFHTGVMTVNGVASNYLILRAVFEDFRYEFASLCAEFVEPGENGQVRKELLSNPIKWWEKWRELLGNKNMEVRVYDVISEMLVLYNKLKKDKSATWTVGRMGTHDIECADEDCEVKSTLKRYGASITVSGQHQLEHKKRLMLYFCRLEESFEGVSINDMKDKLVEVGYDEGQIEIELENHGFDRGASIRNKKYKVLEKRKYEVNEEFPRIVQSSFKGDKYPDSIVHIQYTVDLDGIPYTNW